MANWSPEDEGTKQAIPTPRRKEADVYDLHREALQAFHAACKVSAEAHKRRIIAKEELDRVSKELYDFLTANMQDPTDPQTCPPPMEQGNGQAGAQLRQIPLPSRY